MYKNKIYDLKIGEEHDTLSWECSTYKRVLEEERKRIGEKEKQQPKTEVEEIIYTNAQSLLAHKDEIHHQILKEASPAILALSESRIHADIEDQEVNVPGYSIIRCDAENRNTGGVAMYIRNDINMNLSCREKQR